MTRRILAVGGFAFVGGFLRELLELMWPLTTQWYGTTVAINIGGAFLLAMVNFWLANRLPLPSEVILGLGTGMIGAFTTFSSFSLECVKLLQTGQWLVVTVYVLSSVIGGLAAASAGQRLAHWLLERTEGDWQ